MMIKIIYVGSIKNHLINFFKTCKENICILCESKRKGHNIFELSEIIIDKNYWYNIAI